MAVLAARITSKSGGGRCSGLQALASTAVKERRLTHREAVFKLRGSLNLQQPTELDAQCRRQTLLLHQLHWPFIKRMESCASSLGSLAYKRGWLSHSRHCHWPVMTPTDAAPDFLQHGTQALLRTFASRRTFLGNSRFKGADSETLQQQSFPPPRGPALVDFLLDSHLTALVHP
jgi:hypothetical protein